AGLDARIANVEPVPRNSSRHRIEGSSAVAVPGEQRDVMVRRKRIHDGDHHALNTSRHAINGAGDEQQPHATPLIRILCSWISRAGPVAKMWRVAATGLRNSNAHNSTKKRP